MSTLRAFAPVRGDCGAHAMPKADSLPETNPLREGLPRTRVSEPCAIVLFGATGDLAHRKLVPALFQLARGGNLPSECAIVGFARRDWTDDDLRAEYEKTLAKERRRRLPRGLAAVRQPHRLLARHVRRPGLVPEAERDARSASTGRTARAATGSTTWPSRPSSSRTIIDHLGEAGLIYPWQQETPWSRVVIEKPFGHDLASARALNRDVSRRARREPGLSHRPLPRQGDGPEHPGPAVRQQHLRADLEPPARRLGADHGGRGGRHGRRPGRLLRHRRRDPRHGPEPHDAASLPGGDGAAGRPLGRRRPQREGQGAPGPAALAARGRLSQRRPRPVHGRLDPGGRGPRLPRRRRGSRPTRRPTPTSRSGWS